MDAVLIIFVIGLVATVVALFCRRKAHYSMGLAVFGVLAMLTAFVEAAKAIAG